ncbi:MAG TPA: response regulator [Ktedonobacteraceae bacterium]|nr:response regulator [Ktedonobacteraceae bacterium]
MQQGKTHVRRQSHTDVKSVLIVEDDPDIGPFLMESIMLETPYQAMLVTDGYKALKTISNLKPDLFILDYRIPHINGIELCDRIREIEGFRDIPVILVSAQLPGQEVTKRHIVGMHKPLDLNEFLDTVERLID